MALGTALAIAGLAGTAISAGTQLFAANQQSNAANQQLQAQQQIGRLQSQQIGVEAAHNLALIQAQEDNLQLSYAQQDLQNRTQMQVIQLQGQQDQVRRQENQLYSNLNKVKEGAAQQIEQLNQVNDQLAGQSYQLGQQRFDAQIQQEVLNQQIYAQKQSQVDLQIKSAQAQEQRLGIQLQSVALNQVAAELEAKRQQRTAIRQGLAARALGLTGATNRGAQFSSQNAGLQGNAQSEANRAVLASSQGLQGSSRGRLLQAADIGLQIQQQEYGIQGLGIERGIYGIQGQQAGLRAYDVGLQKGQAQLGEESRQVGIMARAINYNVNQAQFQTMDMLYGLNDTQFALNQQITQTYLDAGRQNQDFLTQNRDIQQGVLDLNQQYTTDLANIQQQVSQAGGGIASANYTAAQAASLASLGSGIGSFSSFLINNSNKIENVASTLFSVG